MENNNNPFDIYENKVLDADSLTGVEMEVKPEFHIHMALLGLTKCMTSDNIQEGFMKYRILVEHLQSICEATDKINPTTLNKEIDDFIKDKKIDMNKEEDKIKVAQFKLKLLMKAIYSMRTDTSSINISSQDSVS